MLLSIEIILTAVITFIVVQSIKLATDGIKGNYNIRSILSTYGGMPSSHAAFVISLTTLVGYREGTDSTAFGIALIFSLIVIVDAIFLRKYINLQGLALQRLIQVLPPDQQKSFPAITTGLQHTFSQVVVGSIIGFLIATAVHWLVVA